MLDIGELLPKQCAIEAGSTHESINSIYHGEGFAAALGSSGQIYTIGSNYGGQLGIGQSTPEISVFTPVKFDKKVKALATGYNYVIALTSIYKQG